MTLRFLLKAECSFKLQFQEYIKKIFAYFAIPCVFSQRRQNNQRRKMNAYYLKMADANLPDLKTIRVTPDVPETVLGVGDEIVIDLGNHYVGYFSFRMWYVDEYIDAPVTLDVRFCETAAELDTDFTVYSGWLCQSWLQEDVIKVDFPGEYKMPRRYAARYVKIKVVHTPKKLSLSEFVFDSVSAVDIANVDSLKIDDQELIAIDRVAVNTLKNCMQRVFEDGPKRDRRLWIGDLRLEALANYETFRDTSLIKRCLYLFAAADRNDLGFLPGFVYENPVFFSGSWFIVDYSMMYVNSLCDYYNNSGDLVTWRDLYPVARSLMDAAHSRIDSDGLLSVPDGDIFIDWCEGLEKNTSLTGVYAYTLENLSNTLAALGNPDEEEFRNRLDDLRKSARKFLFDEEKCAFINSKDSYQHSVHSTAWMVLGGVADGECAKRVMLDVLKSDTSLKPFTPYMHHYAVEALFKAGLFDEAEKYIRRIWGGMLALGADTFFEAYVPGDPDFSPYDDKKVNSMCHAWSCTPTYFIRKYGLGTC